MSLKAALKNFVLSNIELPEIKQEIDQYRSITEKNIFNLRDQKIIGEDIAEKVYQDFEQIRRLEDKMKKTQEKLAESETFLTEHLRPLEGKSIGVEGGGGSRYFVKLEGGKLSFNA